MNILHETLFCALAVEDHNNIAVGVKYDYEIANSSMTASSWMPGYYPYAARLDQSIGNGSWCAGINRTGEFLQVDIGQLRTISKLAVQCDSMNNFRVTSFILAYTENGFSWKNYSENSFEKVGTFVVRCRSGNHVGVFKLVFCRVTIKVRSHKIET